ncbi:unnamed protein product, partial [Mesorhabditis spiculigera]
MPGFFSDVPLGISDGGMEYADQSGIIPYFAELAACEAECALWISRCVPSTVPSGFICQLNILVFLVVIFLAVFTGVVVPITCLFCFVFGVPRRLRSWLCSGGDGRNEDEAKLNPNRTLPPVISDSDTPTPVVVIPRVRKSEHSIPLHPPKRYQKRIHWKSAGSIS